MAYFEAKRGKISRGALPRTPSAVRLRHFCQVLQGGDVRRVRRLGGDWPRRGVHRRRRGARASGRGGGDEEVGGLFRLLVLRELAGRLERLEDVWVGGLLALHPINQLVEDRPTEVAAGVEGAGEKLRPGLGRDDLGGEEAEGGDGLVQRSRCR